MRPGIYSGLALGNIVANITRIQGQTSSTRVRVITFTIAEDLAKIREHLIDLIVEGAWQYAYYNFNLKEILQSLAI